MPIGDDKTGNGKFSWILACILFIAGLIWQYSNIDLIHKIQLRPVGEHEWAQIDRASMALTYHMDHPSFWLPRCHRAHRNPEGITAGEFPLIPYSVSKLYDLFGFHEWIHRLFILLLSAIGYVFAFLLANKFLKNPILSSLVSLCWISSSNIIYYSISFLPDAASLSMLTAATYFLWGTHQTNSGKYILSAIFLSLACLLKLSSLFPGISMVLFYLIRQYKNDQFTRKDKWMLVATMLTPVLCCISWTMYARHLLNTYHIFTFLMEFMPPKSWQDFKHGLVVAWQSTDMYYSKSYLVFLVTSIVISLLFAKKEFKAILYLGIIVLFSALPLFYIVFQKSTYHYYYWLPFQLGILFILIYIFQVLQNIHHHQWYRHAIHFSLLLFVLYQSKEVSHSVNLRFSKGNPMYVAYYDLEPYLEDLHIGYDKKVATYSDPTYNNSLYLMNRKGWTLDTGTNPQRLHEAFRNCDYAVINDVEIIRRDEFKPYFLEKIGTHHNLWIYKLPK